MVQKTTKDKRTIALDVNIFQAGIRKHYEFVSERKKNPMRDIAYLNFILRPSMGDTAETGELRNYSI